MTPIYLNLSSNSYSPYPSDHQNEDQLCNHQFLSPNSQASSPSNSITTHLFFNSTVHDHQNSVFRTELPPPQHQHEGDNYGSQAFNDDCIENNHEKDVKFSASKNEINMNNDQTQVKWMSSKMRVMLKMKKSDPMKLSTFSSTSREVMNLEDHKLPSSPTDQETDNSSNSTSSNTNMPIRVCSDCNTTKTPLWRSGPRGPKSLCNACGIRQRKARRALAAAAAAAAENSNTNVSIDRSTVTPLKVTKKQHKDHKKTSNGHVTKYKKRQYSKQITRATMPSPARKNCVEEFLVSLSKNLAFCRVFPQDEKEAAILLMALSCGYAHDQ